YTCTVRCPRDIKVSEVFEGLRAMAFARNIAPSRDRAFHESFLRVMEQHGRVFEPEMMMRFSLRTNLLGLLKQAPMGLNMLRKGKMPLLPHRSKGAKQIKQRFFKGT
ncbi:MAG: 4Fe-4S dicluster domain-containing protein, partial [Alphaproteobacteria bacterium]